VKGAAPCGLVPKCVRRRAIRKALLDSPGSALTVHVPKPEFAVINPLVHQLPPLASLRMKWMDNLELESATRVSC
jgi:hypothetical protein